MRTQHNRKGERGNSLVETALMCPWIFFLMIGVFDFGMYAHAAISTENAARVAALAVGYSSTGGRAEACEAAKLELANMPNYSTFATSDCTSGALVVPAITAGEVAGLPTRRVTVTYTGIPMFAIPGIFNGQLRFTRWVEVPFRYAD